MVKPQEKRYFNFNSYSSLAFLGMVKLWHVEPSVVLRYSSLAFLGMVKRGSFAACMQAGYSSLAFLGMVKLLVSLTSS